MTEHPSVLPVVTWAPGQAPPNVQTLPELIDYQAASVPDAPALVGGNVRYTYRQLSDEIARVSRGLSGLGVTAESHVGVLVPNVAEWVVAAFAALRLGAIVESFNTWSKAWDLRHLLAASTAKVLIMAPVVRSLDLLAELNELAPDLWRTGRSQEFPLLERIVVLKGDSPTPMPVGAIHFNDLLVDGPVPAIAASGQQTAYVLYTSGTTSLPKAVPLAHRALIESGYAIGLRMGIEDRDRLWLGSPLFWSYGCANAAMVAFSHGACLVLQERFTPESAAALMAAESVTAAYLLPSLTSAFERTALDEIRAVSTLRTGLVIGTPEEFRRAATGLDIPELCNVYGSTETYGNCCVTPYTMSLDERMLCQGPPMPGVELRVADGKSGAIVPYGEVGEFQVRGRVTEGYVGDPDATAHAFTADGWFRTGDTGRLLPGGTVQFVGRATDTIRTSGINVSPVEVESFIATHPAVAEVGVVGAPHPTRGEVSVAFVVLKAGKVLTESDVIDFCKQSLAGFKVPWLVNFVDTLPRTSTGKMLRRELRAPAAALVERRLALEDELA